MVKVVGRKREPVGNIRPIRPKADRSPNPPSSQPNPSTRLTAAQRAIFRRVLIDMKAAQMRLVDSIAASLGVSPCSRQRMRAQTALPGPRLGTEVGSPEEYFARV